MIAPGPIGGEPARRLAEQELSRPEYHQGDGGFLQRILDAIGRFLSSLTGGGGGTGLVLGIVGLVVLAAVVFAAVRAGKLPGRRRDATGTDPLATVAGVDHAGEAERLRAAGAHAEAVREYLRAAIADLERRGVLAPRPGRTGAGAAAEGGAALPAAADALRTGARAFDETWFGARPATADDVDAARGAYAAVRDTALARR